jgi:hypothetical protein
VAFRFSLQPPKTLLELFERLRELLPQLERKVFLNVEIQTTETRVAHGLNYTPKVCLPPTSHCLAMVCESRPPDSKYVYLRASNKCVADIELVKRADSLLPPYGGYELPDYSPGISDTYKVKSDTADTTPDYLISKLGSSGGTVVITDDTVNRKVNLEVVPGPPDTDRLVAADATDTVPGDLLSKLESDGSILITLDTSA